MLAIINDKWKQSINIHHDLGALSPRLVLHINPG